MREEDLMSPDTFKTAWATLYMIFSEQMNQECIDLMDGVLESVVQEQNCDKMELYAVP